MYSQGSYNPYQNRPPGLPPPPPPHFQQVPPVVPPHIAQPGPPLYQHGHPPQIPASKSYLHPPPPPVHGTHMYPTAQQNSQYHSHLGTHNVGHIPPRSDMLQAPPPSRVLPPPPPPSQGQTLYRAPVLLPPPPPPLPTSSFLTSSQYGSFVQSTSGNSHFPPPPPPPSSPPPVPPSPPPTSSTPLLNASYMSGSNSDTSSNRVSGSKLRTSDFVDKAVALTQDGHKAPVCDGGTSDSPLRPLGIESSKQPDHMMAAGGSHSPADSDMEMEDDITQSDNDQGVNHSVEGLTCERDFIHNDSDLKEELHVSQTTAEYYSAKDFQAPHFGSSGLREQGPIFVSDHQYLTFGRSVSKFHSPIRNSAGVAEPLASNLVKSTTSPADDKSPSKGSAAAEGIDSDKYSDQLMKGGSPFRLLQDYFSEDSSENDELCLKDVSPVAVTPSVAVGATSLHRDTGINFEMDMGSKIPSKTEKGFGLLPESSMSFKDLELSHDSWGVVKEADTTSIARKTTNEHVDTKHENQLSINHAASPDSFQKKDSLGGACVDVALSGKFQKENEDKNVKSAATPLKVDKFGRLVREGASDSDSDDVCYTGRRSRSGRSWSRSRSPPDRRRRRRRSPRRRREKRSRSRSRSPRNRRSRSRSPSFRRASELGGDNMRRDKGHIPTCFDFLRGRCHRGASCRYVHHDSDKNDGLRRHRSKQHHLEVPPSAKNSSTHEEIKHISSRVSDHEHDEVKNQEIQLCQDIPGGSFGATKDGSIDLKIEASTALQSVNSNRGGQLIDSDIIKPDFSRKIAPKVLETDTVKGEPEDPTTHMNENCQEAMESHQTLLVDSSPSKPLGDADALKSHGDASQSSISDTVLQNTDYLPQQTENSSISESSPDQTSSPNKLPASEAFPNVTDIRHHPSQLPPPSSPLSQVVNAPQKTQLPRDYNSIPQTAAAPLQSAPGESLPSYMLPNQRSNFSVNPSWISLPPPPPPLPPYDSTVNARTVAPGVSSQFQQNYLPSRNDFGSQTISRPYPTELPTHSQFGEFQHRAYPPVQEPHRPVLHAEDIRLKPSPVYNLQSQQYGGSSSLREDCLTQLPMQGLGASNSYAQGKSQPQSMPYGLHHPQLDKVYSLPGKNSSSSRYPPDILDTNQPSCLPDFGGSRSSSYYNPYTSTFEHPLSSNFSSDGFRLEKDAPYGSKYDTSFSLSHAPVDGRGVGTVGSREGTSSPNSARAVGQNFPTSGGDQYDPLFDSIEPSSNLSKKFDHAPKWESTNDSDIMLRLSGSNKPLDLEENNRKKEVGAVALSTSVDNEEFGETADIEVGAVENESPSNAVDEANLTAGEIEIDQIKSPGKSKKSKESRSMKLFKIAVADFVKEVLKPSWRQGNMSKEAFKTIVKKTVDKVSGAMKSHQIPKSKAKIEQYIDSSQRKLTKLVTGYVDKYVKV